MAKKDRTINNMKAEMQKDWNKFVTEFTSNLKIRTPIDTGAARRAWAKVGELKIGSGSSKKILTNAVGYASLLDKGRSSQEPYGIFKPAFDQTKQK